MKQYFWLTMSTILIMNMCKASQSADTASMPSSQEREQITHLNQKLQLKYPELGIPALTIVPDKNYLFAQMQQQINATKERSPFYEDVLDNMVPLQTYTETVTTLPIILPESALLKNQEDLEKTVLKETYFKQPSTIAVGRLSSAAAQTAAAYSVVFANTFRTPNSIIIPNATAAKALKCLLIPMMITSKALSYKQEQADNFVQRHYQADPLTTTQQVIKDAHNELKGLTPYTQEALEQTRLSTKRILELTA